MGLGGFLKKTARTVGGVAKKASPFLSFVPGVGPLAAAGIGLAGAGLSAIGNAGRKPGVQQPGVMPPAQTGAPGQVPPGAPGSEQDYNNRFQGALTGMGERGNQAETEFLDQMRTFDPRAGFAEQTQAELAEQEEGFANRYAGAMGSMVGQGRLPTKSGFGLKDTQDLVLQGQRERAAIRQRNEGAASRAQQEHIYRMGDYAQGTQNRFMDAVGSRLNTMEQRRIDREDTQSAQRLQDEGEKRRNRGNILSGVLQAGATLGGAYLASRRR